MDRLVVHTGQEAIGGFGCCAGGGLDAGPARDEFVVGTGVLGLAEAFAESVEAVGELAHGFGFAAEAARSAPEADSPPCFRARMS